MRGDIPEAEAGPDVENPEDDLFWQDEDTGEVSDFANDEIPADNVPETEIPDYEAGYINDMADTDAMADFEAGEAVTALSAEALLEGILTAEGPDYTVTADVPKTACIPVEAVLKVDEVKNSLLRTVPRRLRSKQTASRCSALSIRWTFTTRTGMKMSRNTLITV